MPQLIPLFFVNNNNKSRLKIQRYFSTYKYNATDSKKRKLDELQDISEDSRSKIKIIEELTNANKELKDINSEQSETVRLQGINLVLSYSSTSHSIQEHATAQMGSPFLTREESEKLSNDWADAVDESNLATNRANYLRNNSSDDAMKPEIAKEYFEGVKAINNFTKNTERFLAEKPEYDPNLHANTNHQKFSNIVCHKEYSDEYTDSVNSKINTAKTIKENENKIAELVQEVMEDSGESSNKPNNENLDRASNNLNNASNILENPSDTLENPSENLENPNENPENLNERSNENPENPSGNSEGSGKGSLLDDYADPSTEISDYTGGDD